MPVIVKQYITLYKNVRPLTYLRNAWHEPIQMESNYTLYYIITFRNSIIRNLGILTFKLMKLIILIVLYHFTSIHKFRDFDSKLGIFARRQNTHKCRYILLLKWYMTGKKRTRNLFQLLFDHKFQRRPRIFSVLSLLLSLDFQVAISLR